MTRQRFVLEERAPADLVPNPHNFRRHPDQQRRALASSVEEHGWVDAPLWNKQTGHLIDGHARVEMALADGEASIPVKVVAMSLSQERRLLRSFDAIGAMALTDDAALDALIEAIDDAALEQLLGEVAEPVGGLLPEADPDALPETVERRCQPGDLWKLGEHRLLCGDATRQEDVERLMGGKRSSLMATDPPYVVSYDGRNHPEHRNAKKPLAGPQPSRNKDWSGSYHDPDQGCIEREFLGVAIDRALSPACVIYQWHADQRAPVLAAVWQELGLHWHQLVYWVKTQPVLTFSHFMGDIEPCMYGWLGASPERRPDRNARQSWAMGRDVLPGVETTHPTQKPVELFTRPLGWHLAPGDLCYEPFLGSGTCLIAAEQTGRVCYALEIEPSFADVCLARWEQATGKEAERLD